MATAKHPSIDYSVLTMAERFYLGRGYTKLDVPWTVSEEADYSTRPSFSPSVVTPWGNLVGSAEQSFVEIELQGQLPAGKHLAITPCFRHEEQYDKLHFPYFMKLELIHVLRFDENINDRVFLELVLNDASLFFGEHFDIGVEKHSQGYDIIDYETKIELGSYGVRKFKDFEWVYGTGVAEPRFSYVKSITQP